jgi:NADPH-dependent 2,4-dienoyl-CoA reductase/sulfur reductase-like enzyme
VHGGRTFEYARDQKQTMSGIATFDVVVVGAGPAGLAAARGARRLGASTLVIDEYLRPGGQYYRASAIAARKASEIPSTALKGHEQAEAARREGVVFRNGTTVWGTFPGGLLALDGPGPGEEVQARRLVLATGAHDRVMPFPGWTLPGVLTAGGAQALVKAHAVLPGQRVMVAGSGPFLLVVALELARAGATVEIIEAARPHLTAFASFCRFPERWTELVVLLAKLRRRGVRIRTGRVVTKAEGEHLLESVVTERVDRDGQIVPGSEQLQRVDALAIAYGFRVQSELARLAGCAMQFDEAAGGYCVSVDTDTGRTSLETVYAAGEITGLAGREVATAEGTIAGIAAARSLGFQRLDADRMLEVARAKRRRAQAFADFVARTFAPPPELTRLMHADTIVCRCEAVTRSEIERAIDAGAHTTSAVKRWTRCGMGRCQMRICGWPAARLLAHRLGRPLADVDNFTVRLPLKPVSLARIVPSSSFNE